MKFKVIRDHQGDKSYVVNDEREAAERDVAHLIGKCLVPMDAAAVMNPLKKKAGKAVAKAQAEAEAKAQAEAERA
jgi:hypothetical protein